MADPARVNAQPPVVGAPVIGAPALGAPGDRVDEVAERARLAAALDAVTESQERFAPKAAVAVGTEVERAAELLGDVELRMQARALRAYGMECLGEVGPAARMQWEVNRWAAEHGHRPLLSLSHRRLSFTYYQLGDLASSLDHAVACVENLDDSTKPHERANCLTILADALAWAGSLDEARRRYQAAEEILAGIRDVARQLLVLNNLAAAECDAGEWDRAWTVAERMVALADVHSLPLDPNYLDTVARTQMGLGRYDDAALTLKGWLATRTPEQLESEVSAEIVFTLAQVRRLQGDTGQAQTALDRCRALCEARGLAGLRVHVLAEQAEVYAACGDFRRAFETHKAFHAAAEELRSQEREAQARIRQAMFETAEARQDAERFWDQARRDPLTGLRNRRFVDEQLPSMLARAGETGAPLTVAFVDLDHFKRINDTLSHEVGDRVLVTIAGLLTAAVHAQGPDGADDRGNAGFAARMGGEEFLLVLADISPADGGRRLEELRLAVRAYPWREITGDLPVTVSIGSATAGPDSTQATVLARADHNLYAAKRAGRDRVVLDSVS